MRDNPMCADEEFALIRASRGLHADSSIKLKPTKYKKRPQVAILREQGVNGQIEMAAAFYEAGFKPIDVHMTDLLNGDINLDSFTGLIACGGFSYGDVLGAGRGWAQTILQNTELKKQFSAFFTRKDTFSLGVCNGCQMLSELKEIIPGADNWPTFTKNSSEQFEARLVTVRINKTPSIFFNDMEDAILPVPVAHGEGHVSDIDLSINKGLVALQYTNDTGKPAAGYPYNPNGSTQGITGLTTTDGRVTIMMPHPERAFQLRQLSWSPNEWTYSPWLRMFQNARHWAEDQK